MKELKDENGSNITLDADGSWNPVKELKEERGGIGGLVILLKWNPVKELKVGALTALSACCSLEVESGEGIESQPKTQLKRLQTKRWNPVKELKGLDPREEELSLLRRGIR